jgi:hypothetical protein
MSIVLDIDRDREIKKILIRAASIKNELESIITAADTLGVSIQMTAGNSGLTKGISLMLFDKNDLQEISL